ncbi:MAG: hypothetical protein M3R60_09160 [Pseudomonadota bacterium]|nr:hypothetical protein [Pseudomonadota bacterium]
MKSVSLSEVVRAHDSFRFLCPIQSWSQLISLALTLAVGLTCIVMLFMAIDPTAPLAYIVVPVLLGGLAPVFAALPARFEVSTRFQAAYFFKTLDETILSMGYTHAESAAERTRCYRPLTGLFRWKEHAIAVTVTDHAITVGGPVVALRLLQHKLTG